MEIRREVLASLDELKNIRRALHRIPELGYMEKKTSAFIMSRLALLAPDELVTLGECGVKAVFRAKNASMGATAFRADMDALPIEEKTGLHFASEHGGMMHACGHDAHMATALVTAGLVARRREALKCDAVFLFQSAEEGGAGAKELIKNGALENPRVERIFGYHVYPGLEEGKIGVREGLVMACASNIDLTVTGKSAHGATPHKGTDAIVAAAALVTMLQSLVARRVDPLDSAVFTVGKLTGGVKRNIISDSAKLECTLRAFRADTYDMMVASIKAMLGAIELAYGVTTGFEVVDTPYPAVDNDAALASDARSLLGSAAAEIPMMCIGEDFSFYQKETRGLFSFIGIGRDKPSLHSNDLFFEEEALLVAIELNLRLLGI